MNTRRRPFLISSPVSSRARLGRWHARLTLATAALGLLALVTDVRGSTVLASLVAARVTAPAAGSPIRPGTGWESLALPSGYRALGVTACVPGAPLCLAGVARADGTPLVAVDAGGRLSFSASLPSRWAKLDALSCTADGTCFALGATSSGTALLARSAHGGGDFVALPGPLSLPAGAQLVSISCSSDTSCIAAGASGDTGLSYVRVTDDGGDLWRPAGLPAGRYLLAGVSCSSSSSCVAVGEGAGSSGGGVVLHSIDGGGSWQRLPAVAARAAWRLSGVSCVASACVAVGTLPAGGPVVVDSSDGGARWAAATVPAQLETLDSVDCPDARDCFAAGVQPDPGQPAVIASTDGGGSWVTQRVHVARGRPGSVACASSETCIAEAGGALWQTSSGGGVSERTRASAFVLPSHPMTGQLVATVLLVSPVDRASATPTGSASFSSGSSLIPGCPATPLLAASGLGATEGERVPSPLGASALASCVIAWSRPGHLVVRATYTGAWSSSSATVTFTVHQPGYRVASTDGVVRAFGRGLGTTTTSGIRVGPVAGLATDFASGGFWLLGQDGAVRGDDAPSLGAARVGRSRAVAIAGTLTGAGYYVLERDGALRTFGDARSRGDLSDVRGVRAVAVVPTDFDTGYWLLDAEGRAHPFGSAQWLAVRQRDAPCPAHDAVGMAVTPMGRGGVVGCGDGRIVGAGALAWWQERLALEPGERLTGLALDPATTVLWLSTSFGRVLVLSPHGRVVVAGVHLGSLVAIAAA